MQSEVQRQLTGVATLGDLSQRALADDDEPAGGPPPSPDQHDDGVDADAFDFAQVAEDHHVPSR